MKEASKVIMGATLVMIGGCAILLGLVLIILAELYCSRWFCRTRKPRLSSSSSSSSSSIPISNVAAEAAISVNSGVHSLSSFYSHGVMKAPRSLLFPSVEMQKQHSQSGGFFDFCGSSTDEEIELETASIPHRSVLSLQSSPPLSHLPPPKLVYEVSGSNTHDCGGGGKETYVYICNPMFDGSGSGRAEETPFETPDSSPSRLESDGSSSRGDDEVQDVESPAPVVVSSCNVTPPLTPMKKLPAEAVSVPLRDAGSLASECESNSNNEGISSCLSMTGTPCTSPSW